MKKTVQNNNYVLRTDDTHHSFVVDFSQNQDGDNLVNRAYQAISKLIDGNWFVEHHFDLLTCTPCQSILFLWFDYYNNPNGMDELQTAITNAINNEMESN